MTTKHHKLSPIFRRQPRFNFGEIHNFYLAQSLRLLAVNMMSGFTSVFLYQNGYSVQYIMVLWLIYYLVKIPFNFLAGWLISRLGSAVCMMISNLLYIPAVIFLSFVPEMGQSAIILHSLFAIAHYSLYAVGYYIDFSRTKSDKQAGKEISVMFLLSKTVSTLSPLLGGFLALKLGPQITFWVTGFLLLVAGIPMFRLNDRVENRHRLVFAGFPWRLALPTLLRQIPISFSGIASSTVWNLFLASGIFAASGDKIYFNMGLISSLVAVVAMITVSIYGRMIDRGKSQSLMKIGFLVTAMIYTLRSFASNVFGVAIVNASHELSFSAVTMSFEKQVLETADSSGYRSSYVVFVNSVNDFIYSVACLVFLIFLGLFSDLASYQYYYLLTGLILLVTSLFRLRAK